MKRIVSLLLVVMMTAALFTGCNKNDGAKTFTIGFDASFPPYGFKEGNEYVGFDIDLAAEVAKRNGWELKKQPIDWNAKDYELNSGTIDCIWNGFTINGREDDYTWSKPYVDNSQVFVVKKDAGIKTFEDLAGKTVVVQEDSSALKALTNKEENDVNLALAKTFKKLEQVPDYNNAFLTLESGAVDAIAMDIGVADFQIASRGDKYVKLEKVLAEEKYGIGFKKGNTELCAAVEKTLMEMVKDGKFAEIAKKWNLSDFVVYGK